MPESPSAHEKDGAISEPDQFSTAAPAPWRYDQQKTTSKLHGSRAKNLSAREFGMRVFSAGLTFESFVGEGRMPAAYGVILLFASQIFRTSHWGETKTVHIV